MTIFRSDVRFLIHKEKAPSAFRRRRFLTCVLDAKAEQTTSSVQF